VMECHIKGQNGMELILLETVTLKEIDTSHETYHRSAPAIHFISCIRQGQADIMETTWEFCRNMANDSLLGGHGLDEAIHATTGPSMAEQCKVL
jgi:hypothetical protein